MHKEGLGEPYHAPEPDSAAHNTAEDVAPPLSIWINTGGDKEGGGTGMIRDDTKRRVALFIVTVAHACHLGDGPHHLLKEGGVIVGGLALQDGGEALNDGEAQVAHKDTPPAARKARQLAAFQEQMKEREAAMRMRIIAEGGSLLSS